MRKYTFLLMALLTALTLLAAGCDGKDPVPAPNPATGGPNEPKQGTSKPEPTKPATVEVKLYYPDEEGEKVVPVKAAVPTKDKYKAVVEALIKGTDAPHLTGIFPKGTKVNHVTVKNGLATVDFSPELVERFVGGSTGEEMLVGSLVNTLTEFPEITSVQIVVAGKEIETISGHLDISAPFTRQPDLLEEARIK